jgi:hypothetical protein
MSKLKASKELKVLTGSESYETCSHVALESFA